MSAAHSLWDSQSLSDNPPLWGAQTLRGAIAVSAVEAALIAIYGER